MAGYNLTVALTEEEFAAVCAAMVAGGFSAPDSVALCALGKLCRHLDVSVTSRMFDQDRAFASGRKFRRLPSTVAG